MYAFPKRDRLATERTESPKTRFLLCLYCGFVFQSLTDKKFLVGAGAGLLGRLSVGLLSSLAAGAVMIMVPGDADWKKAGWGVVAGTAIAQVIKWMNPNWNINMNPLRATANSSMPVMRIAPAATPNTLIPTNGDAVMVLG